MLSSVSDFNVDKDKENYRNCITPSPLLFMGEPLPAPIEEGEEQRTRSIPPNLHQCTPPLLSLLSDLTR